MEPYPTVSLKVFQGKIKAWRETTTTLPSGMHLGHYKVLFAKHRYSNVSPIDRSLQHNKESLQEHTRLLNLKTEFNQMQQSLAELHLALLNYALECGYLFQR